MPINRKPPGKGDDKKTASNSTAQESPLQRYLAKQKELEQDSALEPMDTQTTGLDRFRSKLEEVVSRAREKLSSPKEPVISSTPKEDFVSARSRLSADTPSSEEPLPLASSTPPPVPPTIEPTVVESGWSQRRHHPGSFFARFLAFVLDLFILAAGVKVIDQIGFAPLRLLLGPDLFGLAENFRFIAWHALSFFYYGWFYSVKGASPGKLVLQLEVADAQTGEKLGYWRAFLRESLGKYVSGVPLLIGFFVAGFRSDHKALHDLIFDTQVVRRVDEPAPSGPN